MPSPVDKTKDELDDNWKPMLAYGLGTGVGGSVAGPVGRGAGALVAGAYTGGSVGNAMTVIGGGETIGTLISGMFGGGGNQGGSGASVTEV